MTRISGLCISMSVNNYVFVLINLVLCYIVIRLVCYSWGRKVLKDILRVKKDIVSEIKEITTKD